jgi:hypothetical protein
LCCWFIHDSRRNKSRRSYKFPHKFRRLKSG